MASFILLHEMAGPTTSSETLVNVDAVERIKPPPTVNGRVEVVFAGGDSICVGESFERVLAMLRGAGILRARE